MGGKTTESTSQVQIPPEVLARYNAVNTRAEGVAQTPFQQYNGQFVAPMTGTQQAALANTNNAVGYAQPYIQAGAAYTAASAQDLQPTEYSNAEIQKYYDPYVQNVMDTTRANIQENNQQQMQGEVGNSIAKGAFGGDRAGIARAELSRQQNLAGNQTLASIAQQGYQNAQGQFNTQNQLGLGAAQNTAARQAAAGAQIAGLGMQGQQSILQGAQAQMGMGQVEQGTQQAGLTANYNQFLQEKSYPFQVAQFLANIAMGTGALSGSTTTSTSPAPFFSDERLKENIEPIGQSFDGQPIYRYNYKGDNRTQIGLLAQDVAERHPEAVGAQDGYLTVDYRDATNDAASAGLGGVERASGGLVPYQGGAPQGGHPNIASYVPQPMLPVGQLITAKTPEGKQNTGLADVMKTAQASADLFKSGKSIYDGWGEKPKKSLGGALDDDANDFDFDAPMAGKPPEVQGYVPKADLPVGELNPAKPPQNNQKSPFGEILDAAKFAAKIAGMGMAEGGAVDEDDLAVRTMLAEAANQGDEGLAAVGHVIRNRVNEGRYGQGVSGVVMRPKQFSPWNPENQGTANDPRRFKGDEPEYQAARDLWRRVNAGEIPDPTNGATHFLNPELTRKQRGDGRLPSWAENMQGQRIGAHVFGRADAGSDGQRRAISEAKAPGLGEARRTQVAEAPREGGLGRTMSDAGDSIMSGLGGVKEKLSNMDTDTKLSLAAGLFGMLSSKSPWLLPAVGEGGLAGINTYKDLSRNTAEIENTNSSARVNNMAAIRSSMQETPGGTIVHLADGTAVLLSDYMKNPRPVAGTVPSGEAVRKGLDKTGYRDTAPAGSVPPVQRPEAPTAGTAAKANATTAPLTVPKPGAVETSDLPPPAAAAPGQQPLIQPPNTAGLPGLPPEMEAAAASEKDVSLNGGVAYKQAEARTNALREQSDAESKGQRDVAPITNDLARTLTAIPTSGWQAAGTAQAARSAAAKAVNTVASMLGMPPIADVNAVSAREIQDKITALQAKANAPGGQVAGYILDMFRHTVPSGDLTPQAGAAMMAEMYLKQQRAIDQNNLLTAYTQKSGGLANNFPSLFENAHPTARYEAEKKAIAKAFLDERDVNGKPTSAMAMVLSGKLKPEQIDQLLGVKGIHRYFGGGSRTTGG